MHAPIAEKPKKFLIFVIVQNYKTLRHMELLFSSPFQNYIVNSVIRHTKTQLKKIRN